MKWVILLVLASVAGCQSMRTEVAVTYQHEHGTATVRVTR